MQAMRPGRFSTLNHRPVILQLNNRIRLANSTNISLILIIRARGWIIDIDNINMSHIAQHIQWQGWMDPYHPIDIGITFSSKNGGRIKSNIQLRSYQYHADWDVQNSFTRLFGSMLHPLDAVCVTREQRTKRLASPKAGLNLWYNEILRGVKQIKRRLQWRLNVIKIKRGINHSHYTG